MKKLLQAILILLLSSCGSHKENNTIDKLISKYPQLSSTDSKQPNNYNLVRTVLFGDSGISLKLYSQQDSIDDIQKILLITNDQLQSYAIPLFSNTYREYWDFQFDTSIKNSEPINTTFEKELNTCLDKLHLHDSVGTAGYVVDEIFYSLLRCRHIELSDTSELKFIPMKFINSIAPEDGDSCSQRIEQNMKCILNDLLPTVRFKSSIWDKENYRIYQFDFKDFKDNRKRNYFKINIFRHECLWREMNF